MGVFTYYPLPVPICRGQPVQNKRKPTGVRFMLIFPGIPKLLYPNLLLCTDFKLHPFSPTCEIIQIRIIQYAIICLLISITFREYNSKHLTISETKKYDHKKLDLFTLKIKQMDYKQTNKHLEFRIQLSEKH